MKIKAKITVKIENIPNSDKFMVMRQYTPNGPIHTDNNAGQGYTAAAAAAAAAAAPHAQR